MGLKSHWRNEKIFKHNNGEFSVSPLHRCGLSRMSFYLNLLGKVKKTSRKVIQYSFNLICLFFFSATPEGERGRKTERGQNDTESTTARRRARHQSNQTNPGCECVCVLERWLGGEFRGSSARPCSAAAAATEAAVVTLN